MSLDVAAPRSLRWAGNAYRHDGFMVWGQSFPRPYVTCARLRGTVACTEPGCEKAEKLLVAEERPGFDPPPRKLLQMRSLLCPILDEKVYKEPCSPPPGRPGRDGEVEDASPAAAAPSPGAGAPGAQCPSHLVGDLRLRGDGRPGSTGVRTAWSSFRYGRAHPTGAADQEFGKLNPSRSR